MTQEDRTPSMGREQGVQVSTLGMITPLLGMRNITVDLIEQSAIHKDTTSTTTLTSSTATLAARAFSSNLGKLSRS